MVSRSIDEISFIPCCNTWVMVHACANIRATPDIIALGRQKYLLQIKTITVAITSDSSPKISRHSPKHDILQGWNPFHLECKSPFHSPTTWIWYWLTPTVEYIWVTGKKGKKGSKQNIKIYYPVSLLPVHS